MSGRVSSRSDPSSLASTVVGTPVDFFSDVLSRPLEQSHVESPSSEKRDDPLDASALRAQLTSLSARQESLECVVADLRARLDGLTCRSLSLPSSPPASDPLPPAPPAALRTRDDDLRARQAFVRGLSALDALDAAVPALLARLGCRPCTHAFRIRPLPRVVGPLTPSVPVIVTFAEARDVPLFIRRLAATRRRRGAPHPFARPNFDRAALERFRLAWRQAIDRNDAAGERRWTVIGLTLTELRRHGPWRSRFTTPRAALQL